MFSRILAWIVLAVASLILLSLIIMACIAIWAEAGLIGVSIVGGAIALFFALLWAVEELI